MGAGDGRLVGMNVGEKPGGNEGDRVGRGVGVPAVTNGYETDSAVPGLASVELGVELSYVYSVIFCQATEKFPKKYDWLFMKLRKATCGSTE